MVALMIVMVMMVMMAMTKISMIMMKLKKMLIVRFQVENLIICNCPHPIAMKSNQRENWRQMLKSWYMVFFQVNKYNETISHHHLKQKNALITDAPLLFSVQSSLSCWQCLKTRLS